MAATEERSYKATVKWEQRAIEQETEQRGFFKGHSIVFNQMSEDLGDVYFMDKYVQKMHKFGQGFSSMSAPTKEFEKQVLSRGFRHDGDLVTKWMLQNVAINTDPAGNIKASKSDSKGKIDGVVAMVMALGVYLIAYYEQTKLSDTDGFKYIDFDEDCFLVESDICYQDYDPLKAACFVLLMALGDE